MHFALCNEVPQERQMENYRSSILVPGLEFGANIKEEWLAMCRWVLASQTGIVLLFLQGSDLQMMHQKIGSRFAIPSSLCSDF